MPLSGILNKKGKTMKKDIVGYEGLYKISSEGVVYSTPSDGKPNKTLKQEIIKRNHTNYRRVSLSKNGKVKRFQVHRLVSFAFIENRFSYLCVNHIDNNGENNHVTNLEWVDHVKNMEHSQKQGRQNIVKKLGGIAAGKLSKTKAKNKYEIMIGKVFNNRVLVSLISLGKHPKGIFKCLVCNKLFNATISTVLSDHKKEKFLACRSCSLKKH
jgi:DNA-directed RNA polymerase subunit RPC12/RpoP